MPLPLSNLVVAALAVGGLATGVSTASGTAPSARATAVAAAQSEEQQLRTDIAGLTSTEEHLESTLKSRAATPAAEDPAASTTTATQGTSPVSVQTGGTSWSPGTEPTTAPAGYGDGSRPGTSTNNGGPSVSYTHLTLPTNREV